MNLVFRRILLSAVLGTFAFALIIFGFNVVNRVHEKRQTVKEMIARSVMDCLRIKKDNPSTNCELLLTRVNEEVRYSRFQVWVEDAQGRLLWKNTKANPPVISHGFLEGGQGYTLVKSRGLFTYHFPVPDGYVDDPATGTRVIVGGALPGTFFPSFKSRLFLFTLSMFMIGALLSLALSYRVLSGRGKEAGKILAKFNAGDLSARFRDGRLDEVSELSRAFNRVLDLLAESLQEVKKNEESRRALLGELSHDLRTPLTSMTSFVQLLQGSSKLGELERECVESLASEVHYLNALVTHLFELSTLESPKARIDREPFALNELIREVQGEFSLKCRNGPIRFSLSGNDRGQWIMGNRVYAKRMLFNLIENALRYAKSEVTLGVETTGSDVRIEILDDGPGFSESALKSFGTTRERHTPRASSTPGHLGLGSVIAAKIAEVHGGQIAASNLDGQGGAKVLITLPLTSRNI